MPLSQRKVGDLFRKADTLEETEELILAYCFSKWQTGGGQSQVLRKLHLLTLYLRAVDLAAKVRDHYQAFAIAANMTKANPMPVILVPSTPLGLEAWNAARRPSKSVLKRVLSSKPNHIEVRPLNPSAASSVANLSSADEDRAPTVTPADGQERRGGLSGFLGGRRSRSNTIGAVVVAPGASADAHRLQAGAGDDLGRGLLSAPPNYDGNLAGYFAAEANATESPSYNRPYDPDVDFLPGYA